uniref:Cytochrome P450 43 n=1 Tax=Streltzoviella insularis TaxID=1206366 RepID=A0A7D5UMU4_9NEOP|nr:cytochrome P450 43 [Streltzoviella insularis]
MIWHLLALVFLALSFWIHWRVKNKKLLAIAAKLPGPKPLPLVGNALLFMCNFEDLIKVIDDILNEYGDVTSFWLGPDLNIVVKDPNDLKVLLSSQKTTVKGPQYKYMADCLGGGILSGSGPCWRKHRKIATPNYGKRAIENYSDVFNKEADLLLEKFRMKPNGRQIDFYQCIVQTTSYTVCQTLMGLSKEQTMSLPYLQHIIDETPRLYDTVFARMTKWYLQLDPVFWLTSSYQQQKNFIAMMTHFSKKIVEHRMETLKTIKQYNKTDLLNTEEDSVSNTQLSVIDRFILSEELEREELLKETFTIFTSSQEASAKISSFLLLMIAYHPEAQEKLYAEIEDVIGDQDRPITEEDLKRMPYLDMVFKEILRLFPIGTLLQRTITEDIVISAGTLPAGCSLVAPIYHLHRDPRYWTRPNDFDPERFSPENVKQRIPTCYIPFSLGPMDCLGRYFGTKLVKTICVKVLREYKITSLNTYNDLRLAMAISASSLNGFHATFTPRK